MFLWIPVFKPAPGFAETFFPKQNALFPKSTGVFPLPLDLLCASLSPWIFSDFFNVVPFLLQGWPGMDIQQLIRMFQIWQKYENDWVLGMQKVRPSKPPIDFTKHICRYARLELFLELFLAWWINHFQKPSVEIDDFYHINVNWISHLQLTSVQFQQPKL